MLPAASTFERKVLWPNTRLPLLAFGQHKGGVEVYNAVGIHTLLGLKRIILKAISKRRNMFVLMVGGF